MGIENIAMLARTNPTPINPAPRTLSNMSSALKAVLIACEEEDEPTLTTEPPGKPPVKPPGNPPVEEGVELFAVVPVIALYANLNCGSW